MACLVRFVAYKSFLFTEKIKSLFMSIEFSSPKSVEREAEQLVYLMFIDLLHDIEGMAKQYIVLHLYRDCFYLEGKAFSFFIVICVVIANVYTGGTIKGVSLKNVLSFFTGAEDIPLTGYDTTPTLMFDHTSNPFITASTHPDSSSQGVWKIPKLLACVRFMPDDSHIIISNYTLMLAFHRCA